MPSSIIAIDAGATRTVLGVFRRDQAGRLVLEDFASIPLPVGLEQNDVRWARQAGALLSVAAGRIPGPVGGCAVALPGHVTTTKFIRTPVLPDQKRARIIQFEARQQPDAKESAWIDVPSGLHGGERGSLLTAAKYEVIEPIAAGASVARLDLKVMIPSSLALYRGFRYNHPEAAGRSVLVNVGARSTQLLLIEPDGWFARTLPLGGAMVTQALAQVLGVDFVQAEAIKVEAMRGGDVAVWQGAAVQEAMKAFALRLSGEINRALASYQRFNPAFIPATLYLGGGGASADSLLLVLADKTRLESCRYEPLRQVTCSPAALAQSHLFAELVGLAAVKLEEETLNLLPASYRMQGRLRRCQPWIAAGVALALALLTMMGMRVHTSVAEWRAKLAVVEKQIKAARLASETDAGKFHELAMLEKRVAALQASSDERVAWIRFLAALQVQLAGVEDAWLDQLKVMEPQPGGPNPDSLRIALSGRMLDRLKPTGKTGLSSYHRVQRLFAGFAQIPVVARIDGERFDNSQAGVLRFECALELNSSRSFP